MQVKLKFVNIENSDLQMLVSMLNQYYAARFGQAVEQYQKYHDLAQMSCAVVAYADHKAVGCGCWKSYNAATAELKRMFVLPDYRREGVAAQMLTALERHAAESGCHKAVLQIVAGMTDAVKFYEKTGYRLIANYGAFADDELCICMAKEISDGTMR